MSWRIWKVWKERQMLNIKFERDIDTDEVTCTISYNHSVYDIFTNHAEQLSKLVATTALSLISGPLDKTFESLELQGLSATEASLTYNNSKTIYIKYNMANKQFEISGLGVEVTPQYLKIAFLADVLVEVPLTC